MAALIRASPDRLAASASCSISSKYRRSSSGFLSNLGALGVPRSGIWNEEVEDIVGGGSLLGTMG